jgi:hypothetical protein
MDCSKYFNNKLPHCGIILVNKHKNKNIGVLYPEVSYLLIEPTIDQKYLGKVTIYTLQIMTRTILVVILSTIQHGNYLHSICITTVI